DIDLPQLSDDLFSRMLLPSHKNILQMAQSHTSGRTTFQGAGHSPVAARRNSRKGRCCRSGMNGRIIPLID
ncbi:hypothetical protein, partial [Methylobacterium sp. WL2]|uniref:hypothetical protein n=1 Tax=Methylobacterium sp. WL2 TaxID=2603902 RepID=UPI001AEEF803